MCKHPTEIKERYKVDEGMKHQLRKVDFAEAYPYGGPVYKMLHYYFMLARIFKLEYLIGRNNASAIEVLEMEDNILTGRPYWTKLRQLIQPELNSEDASAAERVINRIMNKKRARIDLEEDLILLSKRLIKMNDWTKKLSIENIKMETMLNYMHLQY